MIARSRIAVATLAAAALATATPTTSPGVAAPTPRADDSAPRAASSVPRTVYITGDGNDKLAAHKIGATGGLTALGTARDLATDPEGVAISPDGKHAYVALLGADQLVHVPINADGSLGTPDAPLATGDGPYQVAITPDGKYVYTADYSAPSISRFKVGPTGALTSLGAPTPTAFDPYPMVISPNGKFLFYGYATQLGTMAISPATGALSPVGTPVTTNVDNSYDLSVSPDGRFLYSTNGSGNDVSAYSISATGQLTAVGTPAPLPPGASPNGAAMTPDGKFLYTANYGTDDVSVLAVSGATLTVVGAPVPMPGKGPAGVVVTPDGRTLYVANYSSSDITQFTIAANGTLTEATGSPFAATVSSPDYFAITTTPNQGPTAKITKVKKGKAVAGKKVTLKAGRSSDPDGTVVRYVWKVGGKTRTTRKPKLTFTFKKAKTYTVRLRVVDNEGCSDVDISTGHTLHCNATPKAVTKIKVKVVKPA